MRDLTLILDKLQEKIFCVFFFLSEINVKKSHKIQIDSISVQSSRYVQLLDSFQWSCFKRELVNRSLPLDGGAAFWVESSTRSYSCFVPASVDREFRVLFSRHYSVFPPPRTFELKPLCLFYFFCTLILKSRCWFCSRYRTIAAFKFLVQVDDVEQWTYRIERSLNGKT